MTLGAYDLKWTDRGWDFSDNTVMVPAGIVWERVWPRAGLAFIPPVAVLVVGSLWSGHLEDFGDAPRGCDGRIR
jgi:hypothetical protein